MDPGNALKVFGNWKRMPRDLQRMIFKQYGLEMNDLYALCQVSKEFEQLCEEQELLLSYAEITTGVKAADNLIRRVMLEENGDDWWAYNHFDFVMKDEPNKIVFRLDQTEMRNTYVDYPSSVSAIELVLYLSPGDTVDKTYGEWKDKLYNSLQLNDYVYDDLSDDSKSKVYHRDNPVFGLKNLRFTVFEPKIVTLNNFYDDPPPHVMDINTSDNIFTSTEEINAYVMRILEMDPNLRIKTNRNGETLLLGSNVVCVACGKTTDDMSRCAACKRAVYCGQVCQFADWPEHQRVCGAFEPIGGSDEKNTYFHFHVKRIQKQISKGELPDISSFWRDLYDSDGNVKEMTKDEHWKERRNWAQNSDPVDSPTAVLIYNYLKDDLSDLNAASVFITFYLNRISDNAIEPQIKFKDGVIFPERYWKPRDWDAAYGILSPLTKILANAGDAVPGNVREKFFAYINFLIDYVRERTLENRANLLKQIEELKKMVENIDTDALARLDFVHKTYKERVLK